MMSNSNACEIIIAAVMASAIVSALAANAPVEATIDAATDAATRAKRIAFDAFQGAISAKVVRDKAELAVSTAIRNKADKVSAAKTAWVNTLVAKAASAIETYNAALARSVFTSWFASLATSKSVKAIGYAANYASQTAKAELSASDAWSDFASLALTEDGTELEAASKAALV